MEILKFVMEQQILIQKDKIWKITKEKEQNGKQTLRVGYKTFFLFLTRIETEIIIKYKNSISRRENFISIEKKNKQNGNYCKKKRINNKQ